jgi:succinate dehydrogenase / fumarate reductase flavoprotein subunit
MQGLADGYFVLSIIQLETSLEPMKLKILIRLTLSLIKLKNDAKSENSTRLLAIQRITPSRCFHRELGKIMWDYVGMSRNEEGLKTAIKKIKELRS